LTSSSARPVLDVQHFNNSLGEATCFESMFRRDVAKFPRLFRYVTADAGIISEANAQAVVQAGKHYLFALKQNLKWLYRYALTLLNGTAVEVAAEYREWYRGELVIRQLRRVSVESDVFPGLRQFLHVTKTRIDAKGRKRLGVRLYVTSIPPDELTAEQLLLLPRLHWGIENGPNWTTDVIFDEDQHCPCKTGNGVVAMSWLNVMAYNLVAVFRAHLPKVDGWRPRFRRVCELVYLVLLQWEPGVEPDATWV
jgi:predicted transposase YbfD/YdcC